MGFKFDNDVPMPKVNKKGAPRKYNFDEMIPGQSFGCPADGEEDAERIARNLRQSANNYRKSSGNKDWRFAVRHAPNEARCW